MKQYVIDELRPGEYDTLKNHLDEHFGPVDLSGIYWIPMKESLFDEIQASHKDCQPFYFAVDLEETRLSCEFLVRTKNRMRCACINYADEAQRNFIIDFVDSLFEKTGIIT
ncbi:conserved hypothetical protein [Candidatus Magnetomoraceae bacterium gMMP-15]